MRRLRSVGPSPSPDDPRRSAGRKRDPEDGEGQVEHGAVRSETVMKSRPNSLPKTTHNVPFLPPNLDACLLVFWTRLIL